MQGKTIKAFSLLSFSVVLFIQCFVIYGSISNFDYKFLYYKYFVCKCFIQVLQQHLFSDIENMQIHYSPCFKPAVL